MRAGAITVLAATVVAVMSVNGQTSQPSTVPYEEAQRRLEERIRERQQHPLPRQIAPASVPVKTSPLKQQIELWSAFNLGMTLQDADKRIVENGWKIMARIPGKNTTSIWVQTQNTDLSLVFLRDRLASKEMSEQADDALPAP